MITLAGWIVNTFVHIGKNVTLKDTAALIYR